VCAPKQYRFNRMTYKTISSHTKMVFCWEISIIHCQVNLLIEIQCYF